MIARRRIKERKRRRKKIAIKSTNDKKTKN